MPPDTEPSAIEPSGLGGGDLNDDHAASARQRLLEMSRRGFIRTGSIGVVAAGIAGSVPGLSSVLSGAESDAPAVTGGAAEVQGSAAAVEGDAASVSQGFSARVNNLTGELRLFIGNQTLHVQDPALVQRLTQAARAAQAAGR